MTLHLTALRARNPAFGNEGDLPDRIKLLHWGRNESSKGPVLFDGAAVALLEQTQRESGFERVALDYEHNTVPGSDEFARTKEPREVAAFGSVDPVAGTGLYLSDLQWTPSGRANARNYEDLSIAPYLDAQNRVVFVHSAALTRNGAVQGVHFFSSAPAEITGLARAAAAITADLLRRGQITPHEAGVERPDTFRAIQHKFAHLRGLDRTAAAITADLQARGLITSSEDA